MQNTKDTRRYVCQRGFTTCRGTGSHEECGRVSARRVLRQYRTTYQQSSGLLSRFQVRSIMLAALQLLPSKTLVADDYVMPHDGDVRYCPKGLLCAVLGAVTQFSDGGYCSHYNDAVQHRLTTEAKGLMNDLEQVAFNHRRNNADVYGAVLDATLEG